MSNVMDMFRSETELIQAESCFDVAMQRVNNRYGEDIKLFPEEVVERFKEQLWSSIALSIVYDGYDAAMDYARNTQFFIRRKVC